ncbi:MAG: PEP-CTERM sorting domain-containing protein [Planctomycetota bacterium]
MTTTTDRAARLSAYSVAAGAATLGAIAPAEGEVIIFSGAGISIGQGLSQNIDIDGDGFQDINLQNFVFGNNYMGAQVNYFPGQLVISNNSFPYYVTALGDGDIVDASTVGPTFAGALAYGSNPSSEFDNADGAFIGLSFPANGNTYFGWVEVDIDQAAGTFFVSRWAYETQPGVGITIPEPASLGLLAAGAAGLAGYRGRRKASA